MNFTKRYFKLRDDIVQAINDAGLPPLAAEQCLRELRAELAAIVERELREDEDANVAAEQNVQPSSSSVSLRETPSPQGEGFGRTEPSAPTESGEGG